MITQKEYNDLHDYGGKLHLMGNDILPEDAVNEAILWALENNVIKDKEQIKKKIKAILYKSQTRMAQAITKDHDRTCSRCHENLPISMFRVDTSRSKVGGQVSTVCKPCSAKMCQANYRRKRALGYKQSTTPFKRFVANNRLKWNEYIRDRYKDDKEKLSDRYIKKLLKRPGLLMKDMTKEMIEAKRNGLLSKQKKAA